MTDKILIEGKFTNKDELIVTRRSKRKHAVPAYHCIGGNMEFVTKVKAYPDLYITLSKLSGRAGSMFWKLMAVRNINTNICMYKPVDTNETHQMVKAYKELSSLDLVKRIKRCHYMINPRAMMPTLDVFPEVLAEWNKL